MTNEQNEENNLFRARKVLSRISVRHFVFVGIFLLVLATLVAMTITGEDLEDFESIMILASLLAITPLALWLWLKFRRMGASLLPLFSKNRFEGKELLLVIPLLLFSLGFFSTLLYLVSLVDMNLFYTILEWLDTDFLVITEETSLLMILGIVGLVGIIGPVFEESVFRGLMVERLGAKYGYSTAVIFSSILFGFLHIDVIGASLFGFAMCLLYLKTGSLLLPALIHILNNMLAILMTYISYHMDWGGLDNADFYQQYGWFWILILVVSTIWLVRYIISHWNLVYSEEPVSLKEDTPAEAPASADDEI